MKTASMSFRMDAKIRDAIAKVAEAERRSVSSQVEKALEEWLTERGYLPAPKGDKR